MKKNKKSILIADSFEFPYSELKERVHPIIWNRELWNDYDIYYMKGRQTNKFRTKMNGFNEFLRFSKFGLLIRIKDFLFLNIGRKFLLNFKPSVIKHGDDLVVNVPEGLRFLGFKYLASLRYLYAKKYDIVIKTTSSSLFNKTILEKKLNSIDIKKSCVYSGSVINLGVNSFISGANLILNRNSIEFILSHEKEWDHSVLDDVALGKIMRRYNIEMIDMPTRNVANHQNIKDLKKSIIDTTTHYRCKTYVEPRNDSEILIKLNRKIIQSSNKLN